MYARDYKDVVGGGFLVFAGIFVLVYSVASHNMGTIARMGPGMFPAALGVILAGLGVAILIPAMLRGGEAADIDWRSIMAILGSPLIFALLVRPFGLIPAVLVLTLVATRADSKLSWRKTLFLAACLAALATLIFRVGLGLQIYAINWPW